MTLTEAGDTIAAISTPLGAGGIGIVRLSGPAALNIAASLFRPHRPRRGWHSHRLYLGHIIDSQGECIDEVLLSYMRAPHTYTREDVVEINCHSGHAVLRRILEEVLARGARLARPGEFTLRAFLSGRLDLTQAEAVLEVIEARTDASLKVAEAHLEGHLGREIAGLREILLRLGAEVAAALDFPEETPEPPVLEAAQTLREVEAKVERLLHSYREGRLLREGLQVVIAGRPNAGKSSLLNRLLKAERAIVTPIPGTTRDFIEETMTLRGIPVRLTDTAGLRAAQDEVEALGVARTRERLARADLVLYLVDGHQPLTSEDAEALKELASHHGLALINKSDLPQKLDEHDLAQVTSFPIRKISALTGQGLEELEQAIVEVALGGACLSEGTIVTQARHHQLLSQALNYLHQAIALLSPTPAWELVYLELEEAVRALGEITGEEVGEEILERIFARFCIGK